MIKISEADINAAADSYIRARLTELTEAVHEEVRGLEKDIEGLTRAAVKGRLYRAWASDVFPRRIGPAVRPSGDVFPKGGKRTQGALEFFTQSGRISQNDGFYFAIPTKYAGPLGRSRNLTPAEWEQRTGKKLTFVFREKGHSLLVAENSVKSGKKKVARPLGPNARKATRARAESIPIFTLVPTLEKQNRFSIEPVHNRRFNQLLSRIERALGA